MKTIKVLIADNTGWASTLEKANKLREWFLPIPLIIEVKKTNFTNVPFSKYGENLMGVDPVWYDTNISPLGKGYDIILFALDLKDWKGQGARGWRTDNSGGAVELQVGTGENETVLLPNMGAVLPSFFNYARHEICHALYFLTKQPDRTHELYDKNQLELVKTDLKFPSTFDTIITTITNFITQPSPADFAAKIERIRLQVPISATSSFRTKIRNIGVGGGPNSKPLSTLAVEVVCDDSSQAPKLIELCKKEGLTIIFELDHFHIQIPKSS